MSLLLGTGSVIGGASAVTPTPTLTYSSFVVTSGPGTVYTTSAFNIGTADATRIVYAIITIDDASGAPSYAITSPTIGGVAATQQAQSIKYGVCCWIFSAAVPTGTTATVGLTFNKSAVRIATAVYYSINTKNSSPTNVQTSVGTSGYASVSIPNDPLGFIVGGFSCNVDSSVTWTGLTENHDDSVGGGASRSSSASKSIADGTALTVNASQGGGNTVALAVMSWR